MEIFIGTLSDSTGSFLIVYKEASQYREVKLLLNETGGLNPAMSLQVLKSTKQGKAIPVVGAIKQLKISNKFYGFGDTSALMKFLELHSAYKNHVFTEDETTDEGKGSTLYETKNFRARRVLDGHFDTLSLENSFVRVYLEKVGYSVYTAAVSDYTLIESSKERVLLGDLLTESLSMDELRIRLDLSFYEQFDEFGERHLLKNYRAIRNLQELESYVIFPLCTAIQEAKSRGEKLLISIDTETTGLNIFNLSFDNVDKSHVVAIPISWEDNQGVVIFLDMQFFENCAWKETALFIKELTEVSDVFEGKSVNFKLSGNVFSQKEFTFDRLDYEICGHNVMFDIKTLYDFGRYVDLDIKAFFDWDSLQLLFNIYPTVAKGLRKLKQVTRRVFNHETPELTDVLGAGNEGKYRLISDREVAELYGCADTDYTRSIVKILFTEIKDNQKRATRLQDSWLHQVLSIAEYRGIRTVEERIQRMAASAEETLGVLREFIWDYVGRYISYHDYCNSLLRQLEVGSITEEVFNTRVQKPDVQSAPYVFDLTGDNIRIVLYSILKYPVLLWVEDKGESKVLDSEEKVLAAKKKKADKKLSDLKQRGKNAVSSWNGRKPSVDKFAMKKLLAAELETPTNDLLEDITQVVVSVDGKESKEVILEAKKFNKKRYPLAYALSVYKTLEKEYTSYFKPMRDYNLEGKMFKSFSTTGIETRRVSNPTQTMKGSLKALTVPYSDDYYMIDFDMSQIEYRYMASEAGFTSVIDKMDDPEKDYHTETAALVNNTKPYMITPSVRKKTKAVSFGRVYGLSDPSMCEGLMGEVNQKNMIETRKICLTFDNAQRPILDMFQRYKERALVPVEVSPMFRTLANVGEDVKFGISSNVYGFRRYFQLKEGMSPGLIGSIGRKAANYPIQSSAAEYFRYVTKRFYILCAQHGIADKVLWHIVVHDELLCSVHKSVSLALICKLAYEACVLKPKGHTTYYIGMNAGYNWGECKDDVSEMPVLAMQRMIAEYDSGMYQTNEGDPVEWFRRYKHSYIVDRIRECILELQPNYETEGLDVSTLLNTFENYIVRGYVTSTFPVEGTKLDEEGEDYWVACLMLWMKERYGERIIPFTYKGKTYTSYEHSDLDFLSEACLPVFKDLEPVEEVEDLFAEQQNYWSFDESVGTKFYEYGQFDEFDGYELDEDKVGKVKDTGELFKFEQESYKMLTKSLNHVTVRASLPRKVFSIKKYLEKHLDDSGILVCFSQGNYWESWKRVNKNILHDLDKFVQSIN